MASVVIQDIGQEILDTDKRIEKLKEKKIRFEEQYKSTKAKIDDIEKQITELGYDPVNLEEVLKKLSSELEEGRNVLLSSIDLVEKTFQKIELDLNKIEE